MLNRLRFSGAELCWQSGGTAFALRKGSATRDQMPLILRSQYGQTAPELLSHAHCKKVGPDLLAANWPRMLVSSTRLQ